MGVDVKDLNDVYVYDPETSEEIIQMAGRSSRDGSQGVCLILLAKSTTNELSLKLKSATCIRTLMLFNFCKPNFNLNNYSVETEHVSLAQCSCKKCKCCINCKLALCS